MANEYLQRTPTSTGNRKVFTWSSWLKKDQISAPARLFANYSASSTQTAIQFGYRSGSSTDGAIRFFNIISGSDDCLFEFNPLFRDSSSWFHLLVAGNTTLDNEDDRLIVYINGVRQSPLSSTYSASSRDVDFSFNTPSVQATTIPTIGSSNGSAEFFEGELSDIFYLDGQALTPDVFGFYKEGDGYVSAGSTISTDFRAGQWVPKRPRIIKTEIERRGGFGVNGFYLPMNDSSNPGADFHCDPNSIITLKGEDLPQPRNGAPTTTDAYVSQLRSDPYAANLVLAVPGISTATGSNLVSNGNFDSSDISDWTAGVQFSHNTNTVGDNTSGKLMYYATDSTTRQATKSITTESGKRYTISFEASSDTASAAILRIDSTDLVTIDDNNNASLIHYNTSFTAASSSTTIAFRQVAANRSYIDNIVVKQEDAPRDYSADIKGSGSNKLIVPAGSGTSGVGYKIPSYYNSAIRMKPGTTDGLLLGWGEADQDYNFGTGDFTMEAWVYTNTTPAGYWSIFRSKNYNDVVASPEAGIAFYGLGSALRIWDRDGDTSDLYGASIGSIPNQQWTHVAVVRHNGRLLTFCNGVCVGNIANVANYTNNGFEIGQNFQWDGYIKDARIYKGIAKYKGGFDVPKPYTPVGIGTWIAVPDTCKNNFATLNPLHGSTLGTYTNGNLTIGNPGINNIMEYHPTIGMTQGKWYCEARVDDPSDSNRWHFGVSSRNLLRDTSNQNGGNPGDITLTHYTNDSFRLISRDESGNLTVHSSGLPNVVTGDIVGVALNITTPVDNWVSGNTFGTVQFYRNGSTYGPEIPLYRHQLPDGTGGTTPYTREWFFAAHARYGSQSTLNFGQNPSFSGTVTAGTYTDSNGKGLFKYQPPAGYLALCEDNLPTPAIKNPGEHFKTVLYTGDNNNGRSIEGVGFKPDLVWIKDRTRNERNILADSVRGNGNILTTIDDRVEDTGRFDMISNFDSDGFTVGNAGPANFGTDNFVAWCWKAGGPAVTNNDGTITSQVSVNQDAGFSIVSYTGDGSTSETTVGHGLNTSPKFTIIKARDTASFDSAANDWWVYTGVDATQWRARLNLTNAAFQNSNDTGLSNQQNSGRLTFIANGPFRESGVRYIAYTWAEIEGFSKFGSYVGNDSTDGPFVYCGFKPAFVMLKSTGSGNWCMIDNARNPTNPTNFFTVANASNIGDDTGGALDFLSNGFKLRLQSPNFNGNGVTYIFAAFAESPFTTANAK